MIEPDRYTKAAMDDMNKMIQRSKLGDQIFAEKKKTETPLSVAVASVIISTGLTGILGYDHFVFEKDLRTEIEQYQNDPNTYITAKGFTEQCANENVADITKTARTELNTAIAKGETTTFETNINFNTAAQNHTCAEVKAADQIAAYQYDLNSYSEEINIGGTALVLAFIAAIAAKKCSKHNKAIKQLQTKLDRLNEAPQPD